MVTTNDETIKCPFCEHQLIKPVIRDTRLDVYGVEYREVLMACLQCNRSGYVRQYEVDDHWQSFIFTEPFSKKVVTFQEFPKQLERIQRPAAKAEILNVGVDIGKEGADEAVLMVGPGGDYQKVIDIQKVSCKALDTLGAILSRILPKAKEAR